MFLTEFYIQRLHRKIKEAKAEGKAEEQNLWTDWNNRRIAAEANGEEFDEPPLVQTSEE